MKWLFGPSSKKSTKDSGSSKKSTKDSASMPTLERGGTTPVKSGATPENEEGSSTNAAEIVEILTYAAEKGLEVEISFGSRILAYHSCLKLEEETSGENKGLDPTAKYLQKKEYIRMGAIRPPDGNQKVASARSFRVQVGVGNDLYYFTTCFSEAKLAGDFTVTFPETLFRQQQRRASVRAEVPLKSKLYLTVTRASGGTFDSEVAEVSTGGCSFVVPITVATLLEGIDISLNFSWPIKKRLTVDARMMRMGYTRTGHLSGQPCAQVSFRNVTFEKGIIIGEMVTYVQRLTLAEKAKIATAAERAERTKNMTLENQQS